MGTIKTKGIIISENNTGDFDKMLTILTPRSAEKLGAQQKERENQKACSWLGSQFLCFGDYMLFKGQNTYTMNSCETIEVFYNLRMDLDKLMAATNLTKIILDVTTENQNSYKILQLFLNTLYTVSETDKSISLVTSIFKLRLLSLLGFSPNVKECVNCKEQQKLSYFSLRDNGFKCEACGRQDKSAIQMMQETKEACYYTILCPAKKLYSFNIPEQAIREMELISKLYFNEKMEKEYK